VNTADELQKLQTEAALLMRVKRAAGLLGILGTVTFAYIGLSDITAHRTVMGTSMLACGAALLAVVVLITRHTTKVRAQLTMRMRALTREE
jgi:hypothetical protein